MPRLLTVPLLCSLVTAGASAAPDLFDGFGGDWRKQWQEKKFFTKPTIYAVTVDEDGQAILHASRSAAHAALVRRVKVSSPTRATLRWHWKVKSPLTGNHRERTRAGDDYAARVCVIFETSPWPLRTRAINYVWAAGQPAVTDFPSPYSSNVRMFVVRSGTAAAGVWCAESRDVLADYQKSFGEPATRISAVAILVDTDNTGLSAEAWFAQLTLETTPALKAETPHR